MKISPCVPIHPAPRQWTKRVLWEVQTPVAQANPPSPEWWVGFLLFLFLVLLALCANFK